MTIFRNKIGLGVRLAVVALGMTLSACQTAGNQSAGQGESRTARIELAGLSNPSRPFDVSLWPEMKSVARIGDRLRLGIRANADSYVTLFNVGSSGATARLLDNKRVRAGETLIFPGADSAVDFAVTPPAGVESFVVVATSRPVNILRAGDVTRGGRLATLALDSRELASRIRSATVELPSAAWNADVADVLTAY